MNASQDDQIIIAGAGIAGLASGLALSQAGIKVRIFERAPELSAIGAGLQLSPNAVKVLDLLQVTPHLASVATRPDAVAITDARTMRPIARIQLGDTAQKRWGAPYLVVHRADLHDALMKQAEVQPNIVIDTGAAVEDAVTHAGGVTVAINRGQQTQEHRGRLLVGADGVWSTLRSRVAGQTQPSRFSGHIAWRGMLRGDDPAADGLDLGSGVRVFTHRQMHLVSYPIRAGTSLNLVLVRRGEDMARGWAASTRNEPPFPVELLAQPIADLLRNVESWTAWPIHIAAKPVWADPAGIALTGDAAHAMTPFAAQGAAMAIEDAWVLAAQVRADPDDIPGALSRYETARAGRVSKVIGRAALNRFAWHAPWPLTTARDIVLARKGPEGLAGDLDWLYGWQPPRLE